MKKRIISLLICLLTFIVSICIFTGCNETTPSISFKTLEIKGNEVFGKVSNTTEYFSFMNEVVSDGGSTYTVSTNIDGTGELPSKTLSLNEGDNIVYITEKIDGEPSNIYIVTIRRKPIYEVIFDTNGGTAVDTQYIEEDSLASEPNTSRNGYTFSSWDYDFSTPITENITVTANWVANNTTPYKTEYYFEDINKNSYTLIEAETQTLIGTTDTIANAICKEFEHFTLNISLSKLSGNINANGTLVLKLYYTRNVYTLSCSNPTCGSITKGGTYTYGSIQAIETTVTDNRGCEFLGWYSNDTLLSTNTTYTFTTEMNVEARFNHDNTIHDDNTIPLPILPK